MFTPDINRKIASYLFIDDLHSLFLTNKSWSKLSKDERFWKLMSLSDYNIENGSLSIYKEFHYKKITVISLLDGKHAENMVRTLSNYSAVRFIKEKDITTFDVSRIRPCHWIPVFKEMKNCTHIPHIGTIIAFVKYLVKNLDPLPMNLLFSDQYMNKALKIDVGSTTTGLILINHFPSCVEKFVSVKISDEKKENQWTIKPIVITVLSLFALYFASRSVRK